MRILEYFLAALGACLAAFFGYVMLSGATHFDLFPEPYAVFFGLAVVYTVFRMWLDHKVAPGRKFPTAGESVAIGAFVVFVAGGVWMGKAHSTPRIARSSAYEGNSIQAASPVAMMDLFMDAHRYLLAHGFKPTGQPLGPMGDIGGLITPNMAGINYTGSYGDAAPFVFRLTIHRDANQLVADVEQEGATEEKYEAQVKATREFLDQFEKTMNGSEHSRQGALAKAKANVEQAIADAAPPGPQPVEVQITVHKDDVDVDGSAMPVASLKEELGKRLAKNPNLLVTVISEPDTNVATTADVMKICQKLKIKDITFAYAEGN